MRLLVIGQTYSRSAAQQKFVALKALAPDLQLRLLVPDRPPGWGVGAVGKPEITPELKGEVKVLRRVWGAANPTYGLAPGQLARAVSEFGPDHIHIEEDFHSFIGVESSVLSRLGSPRSTVSFFTWDNLLRSRGFPLDGVKRVLGKVSLRRACMVVCGNAEAQTLLAARGYHGPSVVLPQVGLEPETYAGAAPRTIAERMRTRAGEVVIGYFGRLVPEKGLRTLLLALEGIRDLPWRLVLMGSGSMEREIRGEWQDRLGERMVWLPAAPPGTVGGYLKCLDMFVLPSETTQRWKEQFGLVLAEAMMAGIACVGSSSGAIPEVLGSTGLIFKEGDVSDLRARLRQLLTDPALREHFGRMARERARTRFSNTAVAAGYHAVFREFDPGTSSRRYLGAKRTATGVSRTSRNALPDSERTGTAARSPNDHASATRSPDGTDNSTAPAPGLAM